MSDSKEPPPTKQKLSASVINNQLLNNLKHGEPITEQIRRHYSRALKFEEKDEDTVNFIANYKSLVVNGKIQKDSNNTSINSGNTKNINHSGVTEYEMIARIYESADDKLKPMLTALLAMIQAKNKLPLDVVKLLSDILESERKAHRKELNNEREYVIKLRESLGKSDKRNLRQNKEILKVSLKANQSKINLKKLEAQVEQGDFGTLEQADRIVKKLLKRIDKMRQAPQQSTNKAQPTEAQPTEAQPVNPFEGEPK